MTALTAAAAVAVTERAVFCVEFGLTCAATMAVQCRAAPVRERPEDA